ncbi:hypothetical protein [Mucilaginibacter celer]|uniref:hypothetical protein n=1 Tax=Mucilaginibacter celer TaxID=2305508 RepID=UPI0013CF2D68|nr:hypothetical protein [Mucilaginibacter celer]
MRYNVDDTVVLKNDYLDLKKGTAGVVEAVNNGLQNYWVLFDGKTQAILTEDDDLV